MDSNAIRRKFLEFFKSKGHVIRPSSSLIPQNDSSVLFTTAGMQQFKPYYTGEKDAEKDFGSKNITTAQKCVRTGDIDEVGDATHCTFLEMLGNFSFGGYGREKAITYAHQFITEELGLEISYVTFYRGLKDVVPRDEESKNIWTKLGIKDIREDGADVFWGPTGDSGPCGPTTEIYCKNGAGQDVETWNIVFNEYFCNGPREKLDRGEATLTKLDILGIDTGMGFERLLASIQKKESVYETDLFEAIMSIIFPQGLPPKDNWVYEKNVKASRIVADHSRTAILMISDGVLPSNTSRGYVLRRLIRRAVFNCHENNIQIMPHHLVEVFAKKYNDVYPEIFNQKDEIIKVLSDEELKFLKTLKEGQKELEKMAMALWDKYDSFGKPIEITLPLNGQNLFFIYSTYGFPFELSIEEINKIRLHLSHGYKYEVLSDTEVKKLKEEFDVEMKKHQELSRTSSVGMFKGGLANHNEKTVRLHTAHHLLLAALQAVLSPEIKQKGSNITEERLRLDFAFPRKMEDVEKKKVEDWVNEKIKQSLNVIRREMPLAEAEKLGAQMEFGAKYGDTVSVYFIEDEKGEAVSKEFCGGPHVTNTKELGNFKIQKEEAVSAGVRRIKAVLL
ncbi:alanine--tRNA ligase [Candidatus Nomurabacteria bacterium]|nr:alanine--tRNA ligase [Candidatus Nomurabacteria bacterium]